jgi:LysM repeat protein
VSRTASTSTRQQSGRTGRTARALPPFMVAMAFLLALLVLVSGCGPAGGGSDEPVRLVVTPVPSPTLTPEAAPTSPPVTYRVKPGDTLSGIADMFGVTVDDIVRMNNIADPNRLSEGQVLVIPGRSAAATPEPTASGTPQPDLNATPVLPPPDVTPPQGPTPVENTTT